MVLTVPRRRFTSLGVRTPESRTCCRNGRTLSTIRSETIRVASKSAPWCFLGGEYQCARATGPRTVSVTIPCTVA